MNRQVNSSSKLSASAVAVVTVLAISTAPLRCYADQRSTAPAEIVELPVRPLPFILRGFLRRPADTQLSPAVVLLPHCGLAKLTDEEWGARIASWGYATLTIDSFGPRGLKDCSASMKANAPDLALDAYRGLGFLIERRVAHPKRVALVGFGAGSWQTLFAIERGEIEKQSKYKFQGAAAFYPACGSYSGTMTLPMQIFIGDLDDGASADACRKMAAGENDFGISRHKGGVPIQLITYPGAQYGFDLPGFPRSTKTLAHHVEFNQAAANQSREALSEFLRQRLQVLESNTR